MDYYRAAQEAGWHVLGAEAMPSLSSAGRLFPDPAAETRMILLTVRGNPITVRSDGGTPTAGGNGLDYGVGGPYAFPLNDAEAANVNAIQNGGSATGWIEYWGLA